MLHAKTTCITGNTIRKKKLIREREETGDSARSFSIAVEQEPDACCPQFALEFPEGFTGGLFMRQQGLPPPSSEGRTRDVPVPPFDRLEGKPLSGLAAGEWLRKARDGVEQVLADELCQSDWIR